MLKEENLKAAFDYYDEEKSGHITHNELQRVFGDMCGDQVLHQLMKEVDTDHDNKVSLEIFNQRLDFLQRV